MTKRSLILGIDTGGTYTDAAVVDASAHRILATAKAITTKGDLAEGVGEAMAAALASLGESIAVEDVGLVCVSTTLATNAVVEGHGSPAAVVLIGFDDAMAQRTGIAQAFPGVPLLRISGGHDHNGDAREVLDVAALEAAIAGCDDKVSAYAVASSFAVRNNAHEVQARDMLVRLTGKPVTISTELSDALDAPRRALTALLNARLVSRVTQLIAAVQRAMVHHGITANLMIVRGDGTLASAESVALRPIETVLSGPAASLIGAKWLSGRDDFVMSDMGGTTTDVGVLVKGRPRVVATGADVGGWRTMVKAIDVRTIGLGGDSEVQFEGAGQIVIGPQRAVPLALLAHRHPEIVDMLKTDLTETEGGSLLGKFVARPFGWQGHEPTDISAQERAVLSLVRSGPVPLRKVAMSSAAVRAVATLRRKGYLQYSCFTPSDSACVLGLQDNWQPEAARLGAQVMVRFRDMKMPDDSGIATFCQSVWSRTVSLSAKVIVETVLGAEAARSPIVQAVCDGADQLGLARVSISPSIPVVAVGGPVRVYYPELGRRLSCDVVFAPHCDVANAVGAAAGMVADRVSVRVEGDGNGAFRVHGAGPALLLTSGAEALLIAEERARALALSSALAKGAHAPQVSVTFDKNYMPEARDDDGLLTATVIAEAMGQPVMS